MTAADAGVTMIELIIASAVTVLVLAGLAAVLGNVWTAQSHATTTAQATTRGTVFAEGIERAMRNGYAFRVDGSGSRLSVWTGLGGTRACQGYAIDGTGALRMTSTAASLPAVASWPVWQPGATGTPFASTTAGVSYSFQVTTSGSPVAFRGTEAIRTTRVPPSAGANPCWS